MLAFNPRDMVENEKWGAVYPRQKGTAIWQFSGSTTRGVLMASMKEQGFRVLMEVDDNYTIPPTGPANGWTLRRDRFADTHSIEMHVETCKWVDGITVSTENLAGYYSKLNKNIYVCPNAIDPADWDFPDQKPNDGILRIGWGGSASHMVDAPLVQRAFRWASEQPNVEVHVFGIGDKSAFPRKVKVAEWIDNQDEYRKRLATCDVHVCPLYENEWSAGKSDWKALDAAMAGAWPIVSTATPYTPWEGRTMRCTTEKDWLNALKWAVRHRDEIPRLAAEAKEYVTSQRLIAQNMGPWRDAVNG